MDESHKEEKFLKEINIGEMLQVRIQELEIDNNRIAKFLKCTVKDIEEDLKSPTVDAARLLDYSKVLQYDFFRIYTQHLIFYSPNSGTDITHRNKSSSLPVFRKNLYSKKIIDFILEQLDKKEKTVTQIIEEYRIPKTTLYKWKKKYR